MALGNFQKSLVFLFHPSSVRGIIYYSSWCNVQLYLRAESIYKGSRSGNGAGRISAEPFLGWAAPSPLPPRVPDPEPAARLAQGPGAHSPFVPWALSFPSVFPIPYVGSAAFI